MQQLLNVWSGLDLRRQIVVIGATFTMFMAVLAMSRMATAPNMTLLYAGLENGAAGEVVRALEGRGATFEVRGGSIFVDANQRDELRMTLASEGLPTNSNRGYELLDTLSGFGTTSQMFDAAYWRAKEGELARTIVASPHVSMARVHIATTGSNPFQRGVTPTASVSVTPNGAEVSGAQAKAIRFLVASAVAGLAAEDVAVIDANGNLIGATDDTAQAASSDDKAQILREKVERLLEARVGFGNAIVEVSVDTVTDAESIRERRFDPSGRVAISTDTQETSNSANDGGGGDVTVASNLPDGDGAQGDASSSQTSETRERINYEVSETEREIIKTPGSIKRLTVAVLVNDIAETDTEGNAAQAPRSEVEMADLRELVASAVGFDADRGDIITLKSMSLQRVEPAGTAANTSLLDQMNFDVMSAIQMAILALVALVLGLVVVRPVLAGAATTQPAVRDASIGLPSPVNDVSDIPDVSELPALSGEVAPFDGGLPDLPMLGDMSSFQNEDKATDPVDRLRAMIGERQEETVEILRSWLEEKEENV